MGHAHDDMDEHSPVASDGDVAILQGIGDVRTGIDTRNSNCAPPGGLLGGIHALFHGSDLGCGYGGMSCPIRMRLERLLSSDSPAASGATKTTEHLRISGLNARTIIKNCHALLRNKYRGFSLWSMVGDITGHGTGYSIEICRSANLDPHQLCSVEILRDCEATQIHT